MPPHQQASSWACQISKERSCTRQNSLPVASLFTAGFLPSEAMRYVAGAIFPPPPSLTHQATSSTRSALTIDSFDIILKIQVQYVHEAETSLMQTPHHDFSTHARDEKKLKSQMRAPVHPDNCPAAGEIKMVSPEFICDVATPTLPTSSMVARSEAHTPPSRQQKL